MDLSNEEPLFIEENKEYGYIYPTNYGDTYKGYECVKVSDAAVNDGKCLLCDLRYKPECKILSCHTAKGSLGDFNVVWTKIKEQSNEHNK